MFKYHASKKRVHNDPHERIEGLGGKHNGKSWYQAEADIITELEKPETIRNWNYYTSVNGRAVWIVIAYHTNRKYLKTQADGYAPDNLLSLKDCP